MIAYLKGEVIRKSDNGVILLPENIGYFVHLNTKTLQQINQSDQIKLFIHNHHREDNQALYGFLEAEELDFFGILINISGIGPKVALEILNADLNRFKNAVVTEDETTICKIPGIGKKTAKRIILELKDKISHLTPTSLPNTNIEEDTLNEALQALIQLGYKRHEISHSLNKIPENITETEDIITYFIKHS